jgi:hypothetical protein
MLLRTKTALTLEESDFKDDFEKLKIAAKKEVDRVLIQQVTFAEQTAKTNIKPKPNVTTGKPRPMWNSRK